MKLKYILSAAAVFCSAVQMLAVTPGDLQVLLERGEKLTIIDIRTTSEYQNGHIPASINVPESLVSSKKLPPLGRVVVCGSGLGTDNPAAAAAALSQKPGIKAEVLEGGFAAWESLNAPSTRKSGLSSDSTKHITYEQLKAATATDLILVDLRKKETRTGAKSASKTDLKAAFPKAAQVTSDLAAVTPKKGNSRLNKTVPPLLVLIDDGDGKATQAAKRLRAEGNKRVVVLVGGELTLEREGKAGLQRTGHTRDSN